MRSLCTTTRKSPHTALKTHSSRKHVKSILKKRRGGATTKSLCSRLCELNQLAEATLSEDKQILQGLTECSMNGLYMNRALKWESLGGLYSELELHGGCRKFA